MLPLQSRTCERRSFNPFSSEASMRLALLLAVFLLGTSLMAAETSPLTDLLVEPMELAKAHSQFIILDARDRAKYDQGHIPNARWVDHATWAKAFQDGKDAEAWGKKIADLGIANDSKIVV